MRAKAFNLQFRRAEALARCHTQDPPVCAQIISIYENGGPGHMSHAATVQGRSRQTLWRERDTLRWGLHPETRRGARVRDDVLSQTAVTAHVGTVVPTTGDGLHAVFGVPGDGDPRHRRAPARVAPAACIIHAAHGGQTLISKTVADSVQACRPADASLPEMGLALL
jgi:hypothetical protein